MNNKIQTVGKMLKENWNKIPCMLFSKLMDTGLTKFMSDRMYLKIVFKLSIGSHLDIDSPQTFNEKLQWLKIHDRQSIYTRLVDKYEVKEYIAEAIGGEYVIPTYGVWDSFNDIDFKELPDQFVLKCTHNSGGIVICKDKTKLDLKSAKRKINRSLKRNYYQHGREWHYKDVKPRVIAEKYMEDSSTVAIRINEAEKQRENQGKGINDYKFMCFDGNVKCSFVCSERFEADGLKVTFFDRDWNVMPFERKYPKSTKSIARPQNYELMISLSEKLAMGIPFIRVDLYEINGKVYFGELTFYPGSGFEKFTPESADYELGSWIELPKSNHSCTK